MLRRYSGRAHTVLTGVAAVYRGNARVVHSESVVTFKPLNDGARAADLVLVDAPATLLTRHGHDALEHGADVAIAALCAEGVGLMERMVAITVDYMHQRKQFGVAIASFQALRHRIADVKMQLELGRSMSYFASLKLGEPAEQRRRALSQPSTS